NERRDLLKCWEGEPSSWFSIFFVANPLDRESYCEGCSLSFSATFSTNCPAVHLDNLTHNRQPQTESTIFSRAGAIGLSKTVKDQGQKVRTDTFACIAHSDLDVGVQAL